MTTRMLKPKFLALTLLVYQSVIQLGLADHLPANLIARSEPEISLAGITAIRPYVSLRDIERRWGSPIQTDSRNANDCDRLMVWQRRTVRISGSVGCESTGQGRHFVVFTVEVAGEDPTRQFVTGKGLCLGDPFERIVKLYGSRLRLDRRSDGSREVTIQWRNGIELNASVTADNHVSRIQLLPQLD